MPKVLIVEDDELIARGMSEHLSAAGFDPVWVQLGRLALAWKLRSDAKAHQRYLAGGTAYAGSVQHE